MNDSDSSVIERIRGVSRARGANQSFLLDDPHGAFWVERGHVDVFVAQMIGDEIVRRTPFVTRIPAGAMGFGAPRLTSERAENKSSLAFLAVPSLDAVIAEGERSGIASREQFDLGAVIWIEEWVFRLSEFLVRGGRPPPRDALLLEADPDVAYPAGTALSAHHSEIIWVSASEPIRLIGRNDLIVETGERLLPLSERTWIELDADTVVSAVHTPGAAITERLWPALDRFSRLTLRYAAIAEVERVEAARERHRSGHAARHVTVAKMFRDLGKVLEPADGHEIAESAPAARTPLEAALGTVAESIGATLDIPRESVDEGDPMRTIMALSRASGIRTRRIALHPGWWRRDGPPFVGLMVDGERPLALIADGRGRYRAIDPAAGASFMVGRREAEGILPHGMMLYPPLPDQIESGTAALFHALRGRGRDLRTVLVMAVLGGLVALLTPVLTGKLLAEVIPRVDAPVWVAILGALVLGALGTAMFEIVRALALLRIEGRVDERLQAAIWSRLISLPVPFFRNFTAGDLADRANGISRIRQMLTGATASAVIGGVFSIFSFALLFYYSWQLALCAVGLLLVLIAATWVFARGQMSHHRAAFTVQGKIDGFVFQMITGLAKLRMARAESNALARWAERFAEQKHETLAARRWAAAQLSFNSMFAPLASLAIFAFIWYRLLEAEQQPTFDLGDFLSFNAAFGQFAAAVTGLTAAWTMVVAAIPLFERVQPILDARPETVRGGIDPRDLTGNVEFANVSFRYLPGVPNAVHEVSFHIEPGDYVAFVGPSGSGKSTIYRLLLGFEQPDSGAIFLDGHDLASLDLPAVRSRMGVVLQNGRLVTASILKNIVGSSALTMDDAWEAARAAGLEEDIRAMPMGMHTVLSEGGGGLSGGQKQRLLIARALAHKPRIVLFDEATSSLDNRTQAIVQASLKKLSVTRVLIAHRLSTVQEVDRIYVLEEGRIVESGRYDELMERDGVFAALARRQVV